MILIIGKLIRGEKLMKKIRILRFILVIGIIMFVAGCGSRTDISDNNEKSDMGDIVPQEDDELKQEITEFL